MAATLLLAIVGGLGVLMIFASFIMPKSTGKTIIYDDDHNMRVASYAEIVVIKQLLADISKRIRPTQGDLEERLRKSGYVYKNEAEYHARRMATALVATFMCIALTILFGWNVFAACVITTGAAVLAFLSPDQTIERGIKKRKERILSEMGFGLARISLAISSGANISKAVGSAREVGLFGKICEYISYNINTGVPILDIIAHVKKEMPEIPELIAFMELIRLGSGKGQDIKGPFDAMSKQMRQLISLNVTQAGHKAKMQVTATTAGFIIVATMIVVLGPGAILLIEGGIF